MDYNMTTTTMATTALPPSHAFIKLCLLWTALHRGVQVPQGCRGVLTDQNIRRTMEEFDSADEETSLNRILRRLNDQKAGDDDSMDFANELAAKDSVKSNDSNHVSFHYRYTTRSLSVIGVLGGIVLILLVVALSTCIRNRKNIMMESGAHGHESFARQILIDHIRHLSQRRGSGTSSSSSGNAGPINDVPPSYDDVVKTTTEVGSSNGDSQTGFANPNYTSRRSSAVAGNPGPAAANEGLELAPTLQSEAAAASDSNEQPPSYVEALHSLDSHVAVQIEEHQNSRSGREEH